MSLIGDQLSQKDIVVMVIYKSLSEGLQTPSNILKENSLCENLSRTYIYSLCKELKNRGYLDAVGHKYRVFYELNSKGRGHYQWYKKQYKSQFEEVKLILDRIVKDLTGSGETKPISKLLPDEYRVFFSKIVSVKDIIRYMILKHLQMRKGKTFLKEIEDKIRDSYGWAPSSSYLYGIGYELYEEGLVKTWWNDDKRHFRYYAITDKGIHHYKQIADSTKDRALSLQHFMTNVLKLF